MASSSRPFQSQTATRLLSAYRAWSHRTQEVFRRARVGLVWGAQVALYPVYVLFQTSRILYRQVAAADPVRGLTWLLKPFLQSVSDVPEPRSSGGLTAVEHNHNHNNDVERLLLWLQMPAHSALDTALLGLPQDCVALSTTSFGHKSPLCRAQEREKFSIEGIATDLASRSIVLIGRGNTVLDILSEVEQAALRKAISWLVTERNYARWQQSRRLAAPKLPLLSPSRRAWWPVQLFQHLMRWMSIGPVAETTNLFGEANWTDRLYFRPKLGNSYLPQQSLARQADATLQRLPSASLRSQFGPEPSNQSVAAATGALSQPSFRLNVAAPGAEPERHRSAPEQGATQNAGHLQPQAIPAASTALPEADWVETKATVVNYIDHPLVLLLRWVDQGLLWLESLAQQMWKWVRSHITL